MNARPSCGFLEANLCVGAGARDKIKIDKSFLLDSQHSVQARALIRVILSLGRSLEMPVLVEGLETEEQLAWLRQEGCDQAQGYLLGRPQLPRPVQRRLGFIARRATPTMTGVMPCNAWNSR